MKTLLYNPIFINPQAYIVFPNLCGGLKQEIDSVIEPAIFDGKIEVKTIANGDIKLVRYYSNTKCLKSKVHEIHCIPHRETERDTAKSMCNQ